MTHFIKKHTIKNNLKINTKKLQIPHRFNNQPFRRPGRAQTFPKLKKNPSRPNRQNILIIQNQYRPQATPVHPLHRDLDATQSSKLRKGEPAATQINILNKRGKNALNAGLVLPRPATT